MSKQTIPDTEEAWDKRDLGADESFVGVVGDEEEARIDEAAGTQLISIRMQKSMIEDFKMIASINNGIGYQTLMKQILQRFVDCEMKRLAREILSERMAEQHRKESAKQPNKQRKAA
ncbi:MAG: hypothetical protein FD157_1990 [Rhodocyclaceae bacterium]|nr:MAG: hypothetical protein FD157_1990 [Rhodocyclaceae bacterium]TND00932.1 MAG: hypothetical protein FD118_2722 [Rhodocyclaceae bacterium]